MWRWLVVVVLAGCNLVYGLDETRLPPPDEDGDGVFDVDDNCAEMVNPDQLDTDGDMHGDACDTCPDDIGTHDEDGDRRGDVCDRCPTSPDFDEDFDADGVPNACDNQVGGPPTVRMLFDSFETLDPRWVSLDVAWRSTGDSLVTVEQPLQSDRGLQAPDIRLDAPFYHVVLGVFAPRELRDGDRVGIRILDGAGALRVACEMRCSGGCSLVASSPQDTMAASIEKLRPSMSLELLLFQNGSGRAVFCKLADNSTFAFVDATNLPTDGTLALLGHPEIELLHVGAWEQ